MKYLISLLTAAMLMLAAPAFAKDEKGAKAADTKAMAAQIDVNTASKKTLMTLDGIGDVRAEGIIKGRPYKGKDELVEKKIVPQDVYDKIKDQIIAKQKK